MSPAAQIKIQSRPARKKISAQRRVTAVTQASFLGQYPEPGKIF